MGISLYNTIDRDEAVRKSISPWEVSLGLPTAEEALNWSAGVDNKIDIAVAPSIVPNGFDLFSSLEGDAIRFIGSGLGNGDTAIFLISGGFSIAVNSGSGICTFRLKTRPYTETVFANATNINYLVAQRNFSNNDLGNISMPPQIVTLSDGDLIEFSANPAAAFADNDITTAAIAIKEV